MNIEHCTSEVMMTLNSLANLVPGRRVGHVRTFAPVPKVGL